MSNSDNPAGRKRAVAAWTAIFIGIWIPLLSHGSSHPASPPEPLPAGYPSILVTDTQIDGWKVTNFVGPFAPVDKGVVDARDIPGGEARRVFVPQPRQNLYDVSVYSLNARPIHKGDRLEAAVWMRLAPVAENRKATRVRLLIQEMDKPYSVVADAYVDLRTSWKRHTLHGIAPRDYGSGQLVVTVHMATRKQTVDIGHGQLFDYDR